MKKMLILVTLAPLFAGCEEKEKIHDVEYYLNHPEERKEQIEKCRNNPGELENKPNCKNALAAEARHSFSGTKSIQLPVLRLK